MGKRNGQKKIEEFSKSRTVDDPGVFKPSMAVARTARGEFVPGYRRTPLPAGDYADYPKDLATSMTIVKAAEQRFMSLPAKIRARFDNDPGKLSDFIVKADTDPKAFKDGVEMGLFKRPPEMPPATPSGGTTEPPEAPTTP